MDYTFASAIKSTKLALVAISYDIACQWFVNIFSRMAQWPKELHPRPGLNLRPLIPKFHEPAHLEKDHEQYSFNLAEGGRAVRRRMSRAGLGVSQSTCRRNANHGSRNAGGCPGRQLRTLELA